MVDARDLKSRVRLERAGSSPAARTTGFPEIKVFQPNNEAKALFTPPSFPTEKRLMPRVRGTTYYFRHIIPLALSFSANTAKNMNFFKKRLSK